MVESGEMEKAVQQQDAELVSEGVSPFAGLGAGAVERDGDVAELAIVRSLTVAFR